MVLPGRAEASPDHPAEHRQRPCVSGDHDCGRDRRAGDPVSDRAVPLDPGLPGHQVHGVEVLHRDRLDHPRTHPSFGVAALTYWTIVIAVIALVVAVPLSLCTALFITEYAPAGSEQSLSPSSTFSRSYRASSTASGAPPCCSRISRASPLAVHPSVLHPALQGRGGGAADLLGGDRRHRRRDHDHPDNHLHQPRAFSLAPVGEREGALRSAPPNRR